jgi:hypothetical protein
LRTEPIKICEPDSFDDRLDILAFNSVRGFRERFQREERHLRVVADEDLAAFDLRFGNALGAKALFDLRPVFELDGISERISNGAAEQAAEDPIHDLRLRARGFGLQDVLFLFQRLDRAPPRFTYSSDRCGGTLSELDEETRGNHSGTAQAALAVDEDLPSIRKKAPKNVARIGPKGFEALIGDADVPNRKEVPIHPGALDGLAKAAHFEVRQFVLLHKRHDRGRAPFRNSGNVNVQVALPLARIGAVFVLPGADRHADLASRWDANGIES